MTTIKCDKCGCKHDEGCMYEAYSPSKGKTTNLCSKCFSRLFCLFDKYEAEHKRNGEYSYNKIDKEFWGLN